MVLICHILVVLTMYDKLASSFQGNSWGYDVRRNMMKTNLALGSESSTNTDVWSERDQTWLQEANVIEYAVGSGTPQFGLLKEKLGLNISSELGSRQIIPHHLTTASDTFCNREVTMEQIEAVGFDMDWTLAQYNEAFDLLAFNGAKEKLVNWLGYPAEVLEMTYRQDMYRRGCVIDRKRGNILKLDRHRYVRYAEHGLTEISATERKLLYTQNHKGIQDMTSSNYANTDTPFSLVDACLFAQMVDIKDKHEKTNEGGFLSNKSFENLWSDMRRCVDRCHKDGVIKQTVAMNPEKYITYDPNIFPMLDAFKKSGRKVFLLTNSLWDYTQVVMNYLEGKKSGLEKDLQWTEYFDVIIVGGNKPAFLEDDGSLALFRVSEIDEGLENVDAVPGDPTGVTDFLAKGKIFQGGNAQKLHKLLQITNGDRLLYVGDHMYADILRSKRTLGWRTCLIVPELTGEILNHKKHGTLRTELLGLRREQFLLDSISPVNGDVETDGDVESLIIKERLEVLRVEIRTKLVTYNRVFHPKWGPLFRAGFQESKFALQVMDYACLYTSRASNLGLVSPQRPFRPVRDKMPHDHYLEGL